MSATNGHPARDTPADAAARKRAKRRAKQDRAYLAWVHTRPCCVCGVYGVEAHHQPRRSQRGWHDRLTMPLCAEHHRGARSIHMLGVPRFQEVHKIDVQATIAALQETYGTSYEAF